MHKNDRTVLDYSNNMGFLNFVYYTICTNIISVSGSSCVSYDTEISDGNLKKKT